MKIRIQTSAVTQRITLDDLVPEAERRAMRAQLAREAVAEAAARNRRVFGTEPPRREYVDGREGAAFESVKPAGRIDVEWAFADEAIRWIVEALVQASPIGLGKNGHYKDSFMVLNDGMPLRGDVPAVFEEIVVINAMPYARKIERGLSAQAPDGVIQAIATVARRRFGNIVNVKFSYRALTATGIMAYVPLPGRGRNSRGRFTAGSGDRAAHKLERSLRQPAIIITPYR